jgi:hypothetical protein
MEEEHIVLPTEVLSMQPTQRKSYPQFFSVSIILSTPCTLGLVTTNKIRQSSEMDTGKNLYLT